MPDGFLSIWSDPRRPSPIIHADVPASAPRVAKPAPRNRAATWPIYTPTDQSRSTQRHRCVRTRALAITLCGRRAWRRQAKLEARLGPNWQRPKGMHHRTRTRLLEGIFECEEIREDALAVYLSRVMHLL